MRRGRTRDRGTPSPRERQRSRRRGWVRVSGWLLLLLASLLFVTWRQTRGVALEEVLRETQGEHAIAEARRVELVREVESLRSRARVVRVARERLGMRLPDGDEIVLLPVVNGPSAAGVEGRGR